MKNSKFHEIFCSHLRDKQMDVARMIALDTDNERWFQGEMVLAFSNCLEYKILSSDYFNKFETMDNRDSWESWSDVVGDGVVTIEAAVYKKTKVGKNKATGVQKADFFLEDQQQQILSELKVLWISENHLTGHDISAKHLENRGVVDDAWRLTRKRPADVIRDVIEPQSFLTLICVVEYDETQAEIDLKNFIINGIYESYAKFRIEENKVSLDKIITDSSILQYVCATYPKEKPLDDIKDVYLITVELEQR